MVGLVAPKCTTGQDYSFLQYIHLFTKMATRGQCTIFPLISVFVSEFSIKTAMITETLNNGMESLAILNLLKVK